MYTVDDRDRVHHLPPIPQPSVGAPMPILLADEFVVVVAYLVETYPNWDAPIVEPSRHGESIAIVRFCCVHAHMFGPPNDEAFSGHPLSSRGLHPYGAFLIENSSWIRSLASMNSVHPNHKPERFSSRRHYILAFHDSTFECVAETFDARAFQGTISGAIPIMAALLENGAA